MNPDGLFKIFYAVPNSHFNAYFTATTGPSEEHPLRDLIGADFINIDGEEFVECARCHVETLEGNTVMVGALGDVRVCRDCAKEES